LHEKINTIGSKMEDFKQYITPDMDNKDRKTLDKIQEGLTGLQLEKKVAEAAAMRRLLQRRRTIQRLLTLAIALLISGVLLFYFNSKKETKTSPEIIPQKQEKTPQAIENQSPTVSPPPTQIPLNTNKPEPIAERPKTPIEQQQTPLVRGVIGNLDANTQQILIDLLTETEKSNGFKADPNWSKAIDLLKKGKPLEANLFIFSLETEDDLGKMEAKWLLGISLLSQGKIDDAVAIFEKIAQNEVHIRQELAKKVLNDLE
jgi:TolA-binding protein